MDQTSRPLLIPPNFALYAEKHGIFDLYQRFLKQLIIYKPDEPIQFLIDFVKKDANSSAIVILGPPSSGKKTIGKSLAKKTGAILLNKNNLLENIPVNLSVEINKANKDRLLPDQWAKLIKQRVEDFDCVRKGWILENYPQTREQALAMLSAGAIPKHCVFLTAPDNVLVERAAGKRIDQKTEDIYHTTFDMPLDPAVRDRLKVPLNYTEADIRQRLVVYNRHFQGLHQCLSSNSKEFNVDQPKGDVYNQVLEFISRPARTVAPITPRIVLIGATGSGKATQAMLIAKKYDIVNVSMPQLIKQAIASDSLLGNACKQYLNRKANVPEQLIIQLLRERLGQLDCVSKGWVLHGFPKNREQADSLERAGFVPNRIFFLDIPNDSIMERLTLRYIDPVTGENYHILFNPPLTQEIKDRLKQNSRDTEENVRLKLAEYSSTINEISEFYDDRAIYINADQDAKAVFETIEFGIVNQVLNKSN